MKTYKFETDMDAATMADFKPLIEEIAASEEDVQIDMSGVTFVDSSGVGGLVYLFKRLKTRSLRLVLINASGQPQRLLLQLRLGFLLADGVQDRVA